MRYGVLAALSLMAMIAYIQRSAFSVPLKEIGADLKLEDATLWMGYIQSAWYLGYALFQLPGGWVADQIGARRGLLLFALFSSLATTLTGFSSGYLGLFVTWALMGSFQAGVFPCTVKSIGAIFPEKERSRASGLLACGMLSGGALGPWLTAKLLEAFVKPEEVLDVDRWRFCLMLFGVPGVLWVMVYALGTSDAQFGKTSGAAASAKRPFRWEQMLTSPSLILLCSQQFLRAAGMVFFLTWFPTFLMETRGVTTQESGTLTMYAGLAAMAGSLLGGFFSDWLYKTTGQKWLSRQGIAVLGMATCATLIVVSYFVSSIPMAIGLISLGAFAASFGGVSGYTVAIDFGGKHVATVFGAMNMCGNFGAMLFPVTVGLVVTWTKNWNLALFIFAGLMAVDAVCWAMLNPSGTLFDDEAENSHETT